MKTSIKMKSIAMMVMLTVACASAFAQKRAEKVEYTSPTGQKVVLFRGSHVTMDYATEQLTKGAVDTLVDAHRYRATGKKEFFVVNHKYFLQNGEVQIEERRTKWEQVNTADMSFEDMKNVVDGSGSVVDYRAKDLLHRNLAHFQIGVSGGALFMTKTNFIMPMAGINIDIHGRRGFVFGVDGGFTFLHPYLDGTVGATTGAKFHAPYFGAHVGYKFWFNRNKNSYISPSVFGRFCYTRSDMPLEEGGVTVTYAPAGGVMVESGFVFAEHFVVKGNVWANNGTTLPHNSPQDVSNITVGASLGVAVLLHFKTK